MTDDPFWDRARGLAGKITPNTDSPVRLRTWTPQQLPIETAPKTAKTSAQGKAKPVNRKGRGNQAPPLRS